MSVFRIPKQPIIDINSKHLAKVPVSFLEGFFYIEDFDKLASLMPDDNKLYIYQGGINRSARIKFPNRQPDYSLVHLAFSPSDQDTLFEKESHWAILLCPLGNVNKPGVAEVYETTEAMRHALYGDDNPNKEKKSFLELYVLEILSKNSLKHLGNVANVIELAKNEAKSEKIVDLEIPKLLPSRTSITFDFLKHNYPAPTWQQLDEIFGD